jgi:hypothetical protein
MSYQCPKCSGVIYNRRNKTCGFCGAELPAELLFSAAELEALDKRDAEMAAEHQKQQAKFEAEEQERKDALRRQVFWPGSFP